MLFVFVIDDDDRHDDHDVQVHAHVCIDDNTTTCIIMS